MPNIIVKKRNQTNDGFDELLVKAYWDWEDKVTLSTGEKVYELTLADITGPEGPVGPQGDPGDVNIDGGNADIVYSVSDITVDGGGA